jgi:hypothetical protein
MRDFSAVETANYAAESVEQLKGLFQQLFETIVNKIKTLAVPNINPIKGFPSHDASKPTNFNMNDMVILIICVVAAGLFFTKDADSHVETSVPEVQQSVAAQLSHAASDPAMLYTGSTVITFGERKIIDHITAMGIDNNKLVCELFLETVKQTTGWWGKETELSPYERESKRQYRSACNKLLKTDYGY